MGGWVGGDDWEIDSFLSTTAREERPTHPPTHPLHLPILVGRQGRAGQYFQQVAKIIA